MNVIPAATATSDREVDLLSCADEPIHIPGSIQPHGVLLYFCINGLLEGWSANAVSLVDSTLQIGTPFTALGLPGETLGLIQDCVDTALDGEAGASVASITVGAREYDCIVHAYHYRIVAEFEIRTVPATDVAMFAVRAHGAIDHLRRQKTVAGLLEIAVRRIREMTGFDRVMAYRFRQDESGDVMAEDRRADLTPYLGQRYPASDIPAQARRLYALNTLRVIADIGYQSVPLLGAAASAPLDMSFAVLRSVSPIHVEYLQNMGVGASMSVSIVINGRLWGLIACHHNGPKQVPYAIRMAADVLAQVLASTIQSIESKRDADVVQQAASARSALVESMLLDDDPLEALQLHAEALRASGHAAAMVCSLYGKVVVYGAVPAPVAEAIVASLPGGSHELQMREQRADWPQSARDTIKGWVGMLALPFDPPGGGWCIMLRQEQIENVIWAGQPEKGMRTGPMGARLTPRGSFDAWCETVVGHAEPWEPTVLANARLMLAEMLRVSTERRAQTESTRAQLLAMLGHDLRDPLHSINMAGMVLERGTNQQDDKQAGIGRRIQSSSNRMQRLIGQVLDMSRIDGGIGLGLATERIDLAMVVEDLVDEARTAYPAIAYQLDNRPQTFVQADSARMAQVLSNLLSNARHHGEPGQPIAVRADIDGHHALVDVVNRGAPIPSDSVATLFNPFKRTSLHNPRNRTGMGLGLYIAQQIVREHRGELLYRHEEGKVIFTVRLPHLA
ncbi:ATP-binding protein [Massilia sp. S19_KUP03_FR1]|uniref:ATP-binding protein n=1 Tax=Massilia sp. S19_KUP03_FR1 TaxID=3025503 RepID=UPI002FCD6CB6